MYAKVIKWLSYAMMLALAVITILCVVKGMVETTAEGVERPTEWANVFLWMGYVMACIPIVVLIGVGGVLGAINNPKGLIKLLGFLVLFVVVIAVCYLIAPNAQIALSQGKMSTPLEAKIASTALYVITIALCGIILSILAGGIYRLIKK